jgi:photoactive yellow protein
MLQALSKMSNAQLDSLPFGVVRLSDSGEIKFYNTYETTIADVSKEAAEGRNFFTQVAPCTNNRLVYGRFKAGVAADSLDEELKYTLTYKLRPTLVTIRLYRDKTSATNWILIKRLT